MKNLLNVYRKIYRIIRNKIQKVDSNKNITIISMNCVGGVVYNNFNLKFCSPTINLWFKPKDFIKLLKRLKYYLLECEMIFNKIESDRVGYPVGLLDDINVYFQHYDNYEYAKNKWCERCKRVDWDHLFIVMVQRDGCTEKELDEFEKLPYKNKVVFTYRDYPEFSSSYHINKSNLDNENVIDLCKYKRFFSTRRYLDDFDWIDFLKIRK